MLSQVTGRVVDVGEHSVTLQVGDLCYDVLVPSSVANQYKKTVNGQALKEPDTFYTIQYIEGASGHGNQFMRLVGFKRKVEKDFFQLYTSVEGIGYKTALRSLIFPIQKIAMAIERGDLATLKKLPQIGSRTAEKMVATLKGRMQKFALDLAGEPLTTVPETDLHSEVLQVLRQVGYDDSESRILVDKALHSNPKIKSAEDMIQEIFRMKASPEAAGKN